MHSVRTIDFDLNATKQLIDEILIEKLLKYNKNGFYREMKRKVELKVHDYTFFEQFSQLCTKKISVNRLAVYLPIANQEEFVTRLKALLGNEQIHVSALSEFKK